MSDFSLEIPCLMWSFCFKVVNSMLVGSSWNY